MPLHTIIIGELLGAVIISKAWIQVAAERGSGEEGGVSPGAASSEVAGGMEGPTGAL